MNRRALITGIEGFTGQYVAAALAADGWEVWGTGQRAEGEHPRYVQADLTDGALLSALVSRVQPQLVVHLAAIAFVAHGDADAFYDINLKGTRRLLAALAAASVPPARVIVASSANIYGNQTEGVLNEDTPANPANDYAVSKLAMEHMARLWMGQLPIVITRPFNYTGVGQSADFLIPKIMAHFRERAPVLELGNLDVARDFSDVRDIATAYARLATAGREVDGQTVNLCSGRSRSLEDVLLLAERASGYRPEIRVNPAFVRSNEVKTLQGSRARLESLVEPWPLIPFTDTLAWMLGGD